MQFSVVTVGTTARREVQIFNDGHAALDIAPPQLLAPGVAAGVLVLETAAALAGASFRPLTVAGGVSPHFRLWRDDGTALPVVDIVLGGGQTFIVVVEFAAASIGGHVARLDIRATAPSPASVAVTLRGRAV